MKILFTGFEPFGGETVNPAWQAVSALPDEIAGAAIVRRELPTEFGRAGALLADILDAERPDAALLVGQAGGRAAVTVERVAINLRDARIPDNAGFRPEDEPVAPGGETAYFATVPVKALVRAITDAGVPAAVSDSAGTFVCNELFYTLLRLGRERYPALRGGFIHVPYSEAQLAGKPEGTPGLALSRMTAALAAAARALARDGR